MRVGDQVQGFVLEKLLEEDREGKTFLASHPERRKKLRFRLLDRSTLASDDQMRFVVELKLVSKLSQPNLLEIVDAGETPEGLAFFVTELVEAKTLAERWREGTLRVPALLAILFDVAVALEAAHKKRLIHGGLTADTILLVGKPGEQPTAKITDFGYARARARKILDAQADVRAIGLMFAAHPLSPQLDLVMRRARSTDPAERYPTMRALREDLRRLLRGEPLAQKAQPNAATAVVRILDRTPPPDVVVAPPPSAPAPAQAPARAPRKRAPSSPPSSLLIVATGFFGVLFAAAAAFGIYRILVN